MLPNCRNMHDAKATGIGGEQNESDVGVDDEELLLAQKISMATTPPKPSKLATFDE